MKTANSAYYAHAHAWLQYGILLWGNSTYAFKLFKLHKIYLGVDFKSDFIVSCKPYFKFKEFNKQSQCKKTPVTL